MQILTRNKLRKEVSLILERQGYEVNRKGFFLAQVDREIKREVHVLAKTERLSSRKEFIIRNAGLIKENILEGKDLVVEKINPRLIEVKANTKWEKLFRWWNLVWWSLPYERAYGRQIRFVVWDEYHRAPIGLIGLQSPILSWSVRDEYLNIPIATRDYWVNQSLSAQRLGALPPYNQVLGGKLVAYLLASNRVRDKFKDKYANTTTVLQNRELPARLLFITTTGAYGKSSVYTRLKYFDQYVARFIGYTHGSGSFHIPNSIFDKLIAFLKEEGHDVRRGYGSGPSRKLRLITQALSLLGFKNGSMHGIRRAVYLFPFVENLRDVIQKNDRPIWHQRTIKELTDFWKQRWALPRIQNDLSYREFKGEKFMKDVLLNLQNPKEMCRGK